MTNDKVQIEAGISCVPKLYKHSLYDFYIDEPFHLSCPNIICIVGIFPRLSLVIIYVIATTVTAPNMRALTLVGRNLPAIVLNWSHLVQENVYTFENHRGDLD